jgi:hypothetical protein
VATQFSDDLLKRYVLGELADDEQTAVEEAYFGDQRLYERLRAVEEELVEASVRGELSEGEREKIAARLERSPTLRGRARLASILAAALEEPDAAPVPRRAPSPDRRGPWWAGFVESVRAHRFAFAVAAVALVVGFVGLWLLRDGGGPAVPPESASTSQPPEPGPSNSAAPAPGGIPADPPAEAPPPSMTNRGADRPGAPGRASVAAFVLSPAFSRSGAAAPELRVPAGTRYLRLTLPLADAVAGELNAAIRTYDGDVVWRARGLRARGAGSRRAVEVTAPASALGDGPYLLTLERPLGNGEHETVEEFSFAVVRLAQGRAK